MQTPECYILSSKKCTTLKCLSIGHDCLSWPMILACLDHLHLKFASTKLLAIGTMVARVYFKKRLDQWEKDNKRQHMTN